MTVESAAYDCEEVIGDECVVRPFQTTNPVLFRAPSQSCLDPCCNVIGVDEAFDFALLGPHAPTRVSLVRQDGTHCRVRPAARVTMGVAGWVMSAGRGDPLVRECLSD